MLTHSRHQQPVSVQPSILVLCRGTSERGVQQWVYICMLPTQAEMFYTDRAKGRMNLEDYGTILEYGDGAEPDAETRKRMRELYGFRDDYEDSLRKMVDAKGGNS